MCFGLDCPEVDLKQGSECKWLIWPAMAGHTGRRMGRDMGKGRQPTQGVLRAGDFCERRLEFSVTGDFQGTVESMPQSHPTQGVRRLRY